MKPRKYVYFVAFAYTDTQGRPKFGNAEVTASRDVQDMVAVDVLTKLISDTQPSIQQPVIINWKYLRVEVVKSGA